MTSSITLPARLDLPAAGLLRDQFLSHRGKALACDASEVTHLGTNCLQVLLSAAKTWAADGCTLSIVDATPEFTQQIQNFGVSLDSLSNGAT